MGCTLLTWSKNEPTFLSIIKIKVMNSLNTHTALCVRDERRRKRFNLGERNAQGKVDHAHATVTIVYVGSVL